MADTKKTIKVFCTNCQTETDHTGAVDGNGELVFTCAVKGCGRFLKVPVGKTVDEIKAYFVEHKDGNEGQVSIQPSIDTLDAVMG